MVIDPRVLESHLELALANECRELAVVQRWTAWMKYYAAVLDQCRDLRADVYFFVELASPHVLKLSAEEVG